MTDSSHDDRRIDTRVDKVHLVQISRVDEEGFRADLATGRTLNMSTGGLRLELNHPLPLRSEVSLDVALGDRLLHINGTVVYLEALDDQRCCMGIAFEQISPEDQQRLEAELAAQDE